MTPDPNEVRRAILHFAADKPKPVKDLARIISSQMHARDHAITEDGRKFIDAAIEKNMQRLAAQTTG